MALTEQQKAILDQKVSSINERKSFDPSRAVPVDEGVQRTATNEFDPSRAKPVEQSPESQQFGFFGSVPTKDFERGERNVAGNLFERTASAIRGAVQGLPTTSGGVIPGTIPERFKQFQSPVEGFRKGSLNPADVPSFFDLQSRSAISFPTGNQLVDSAQALSFPSMASTGAGLAMDVATSPADVALLIAGNVTGMVRGAGKAAIDSVKNSGKLSTTAEVMQVPKARLPQLTKAERAEYFRVRSNKLQSDFKASDALLKEERKQINRQLGLAGKDRSLEIRKIATETNFLGKFSAHYRRLADRELAPLANENILTRELAQFAKQKYSGKHQAETLSEVSSRLGLSNEAVEKVVTSPILDDLGRPIQQVVPDTVKLGQLYNQAKDLGQTIPSSVRLGSRVFSRDEFFANESISTIFDFLKTKNIDLSTSNRFWTWWKPIQKQFVSESKLFNISDTQTQSLATRVIKLAKGIDPNNEIYGKTIARGLGLRDLPGPVNRVVSKLNSNQKAIVANEIAKQEAIGALQAFRFEVGQKASSIEKSRMVSRWILGLLGGSVVLNKLRQAKVVHTVHTPDS